MEYKVKRLTSVSAITLVVLLTGCNTLPTYEFSPNEKVATLKALNKSASMNMCYDDTLYRLKKDKDSGLIRIPAGKRISIGSHATYSAGYNLYSCQPFVSFVPLQGNSYVTDTNVISDVCRIELVRESDISPNYLMAESTLARNNCSFDKDSNNQ